jgi:hypothetical protein
MRYIRSREVESDKRLNISLYELTVSADPKIERPSKGLARGDGGDRLLPSGTDLLSGQRGICDILSDARCHVLALPPLGTMPHHTKGGAGTNAP